MSIAAVRAYFAQFGMADQVLEFETSSATVELAAQAGMTAELLHDPFSENEVKGGKQSLLSTVEFF